MELNLNEFKKLFKSQFNSNYNFAGRELGVSPAQVYRIIKKQSKAGPEFLKRLMIYCSNKGIDYRSCVIFFMPTVNCM